VAHGSWRPGADLRRFRLAVTRAGLSAEMGDARKGIIATQYLSKALQKLMFAALGFTPLSRNAIFR